MPAGRGGRAVAAIGLAVALLAHVAIAWYPFTLDPPRPATVEVTRLADGSVRLAGERVVVLGAPPWAGGDLRADEVVTVELEVRPARRRQGSRDRPARILAVSHDYSHANLVVGQARTDLVVRVRRDGADAAGHPPLRVPGALARDRWVRLRAVVRPDEVLVEVDGRVRARQRVDVPPVGAWDPSYAVALGDERLGARVWHGRVRQATIRAGDRATDYLAPGRLEVADRAWYVPERLREVALVPAPSAVRRSALHLVAFVPVGALLVLARRSATARSAVLLAAAVSVLLQLGKIGFAARHPSWLTAATQVAGALAGAVTAVRLRRPPR